MVPDPALFTSMGWLLLLQKFRFTLPPPFSGLYAFLKPVKFNPMELKPTPPNPLALPVNFEARIVPTPADFTVIGLFRLFLDLELMLLPGEAANFKGDAVLENLIKALPPAVGLNGRGCNGPLPNLEIDLTGPFGCPGCPE